MAISQARAHRKVTGSRYSDLRKKKVYQLGRDSTLTRLEEQKKKKIRTMSGNHKEVLLSCNSAYVIDPKTKKTSKAIIKTVVENPANRHFVRRNILTKGTIIDTDKGKARITNRPGQEGAINAVLIKEEKN